MMRLWQTAPHAGFAILILAACAQPTEGIQQAYASKVPSLRGDNQGGFGRRS